jgi:hypothetical protein
MTPAPYASVLVMSLMMAFAASRMASTAFAPPS